MQKKKSHASRRDTGSFFGGKTLLKNMRVCEYVTTRVALHANNATLPAVHTRSAALGSCCLNVPVLYSTGTYTVRYDETNCSCMQKLARGVLRNKGTRRPALVAPPDGAYANE